MNQTTNKPLPTELIFVTPEMATAWLEKVPVNQRNIIKGHLEQIIVEHLADKFSANHDPVVFDIEGNLWNSQHRLSMIKHTGKGLWMNVLYNAPREYIANLDRGRSRSRQDALVMCGKVAKGKGSKYRALLNAYLQGCAPTLPFKGTQDEFVELYDKYSNALYWAESKLPGNKKGISRAPVLAGVARAYYNYQSADSTVKKISQFCELLVTGISTGDPNEVSVIKLRDLLHSDKLPPTGASSAGVVCRHVCRVLKAYLEGQTITVNSKVPLMANYFPINEDNPKIQEVPFQKLARLRKTNKVLVEKYLALVHNGVENIPQDAFKQYNGYLKSMFGSVTTMDSDTLEKRISYIENEIQSISMRPRALV